MSSRFQFSIRQLLISTAWFAAALGMISYLVATWVDDLPLPSIFLLALLSPAAFAGGVGALFGRAGDWAMVGLIVAPVGLTLLAPIG